MTRLVKLRLAEDITHWYLIKGHKAGKIVEYSLRHHLYSNSGTSLLKVVDLLKKKLGLETTSLIYQEGRKDGDTKLTATKIPHLDQYWFSVYIKYEDDQDIDQERVTEVLRESGYYVSLRVLEESEHVYLLVK